MHIERNFYLNQLISKMNNGKVKIITGIRRCGKSYLLSHIFKDYLLTLGVPESRIIEIALDKKQFEDLRNPNSLYDYVLNRLSDSDEQYYLFIDEIQLSYRVKKPNIDISLIPEDDRELIYTSFYDILNDLMTRSNLDIYVTGSNSKMLSTDVATNFRDRGTEIKLYPLSFAEFYPVSGKEKADAWEEYIVYGGMPTAVLEPDEREKAKYLSALFSKVYVADFVERYGVSDAYIENLIDVLASSVGSLTNASKLSNTLNSVNHAGTSDKTIKKYLDALEDAFLFRKAVRYDIKGKSYLDSPVKYYATDLGLRNARLNFRQVEPTHLMENAIYNELVRRGYSVDVGVVRFAETVEGKKNSCQHEIDFIVNVGRKKIYIQSAFSIPDEAKHRQEVKPLCKTGDSFQKIVVVGGSQKPGFDDDGIKYIGVIPFLLDEASLE